MSSLLKNCRLVPCIHLTQPNSRATIGEAKLALSEYWLPVFISTLFSDWLISRFYFFNFNQVSCFQNVGQSYEIRMLNRKLVEYTDISSKYVKVGVRFCVFWLFFLLLLWSVFLYSFLGFVEILFQVRHKKIFGPKLSATLFHKLSLCSPAL